MRKGIKETGILLIIFLLFFNLTPGWSIQHPLDTLEKQEEAQNVFETEYIPDTPYDLLQDRLSCIEGEIPLHLNTRVKAFIDYFCIKDRDYSRAMLEKKNLYFPLFEKYLRKYDLPQELKYLSIIESGLNPRALSRVGAGGLWQFMPRTARQDYKMKLDWYIDERFDPEKSTEAACRYLKFLYNYFGDWELALAAYNTGPGNVRRALRRSGYKKTFWEAYRYFPRDTRSYVPQFVAIMYTMEYADEHNLSVDYPLYPMETDTISISHYLDLKTFAELTDICFDDLTDLNPELKRAAVPDYVRNYGLKIPADKYEFIRENRSFILDSASKKGKEALELIAKNSVGSTYGRTKIIYKVKSGDVIGTIAERYKVRTSDIRTWNNIRRNIIRVDQKLELWVKADVLKNVNNRPVASQKKIQIPPNAKTYLVQPGDTLWDISRKYKDLSIEKIKKLNNLRSNKIKPGQTLVVG
ncbi:transglycosylase SLT domain-containing protein [Fulvivirgaceae bacterium BMA10]|uniref:Transglycosylase SLT domain-containing protein n=1 Tax=Splendidivirga corallicola TaxID=3051826 RepID=A0ABT8KS28_9BACT|nr:transglycosylase SLT domain-containing protein [Fulvivirgaceae bacterium BMA10]